MSSREALLKVLRIAEQLAETEAAGRRVRPNMWHTLNSLTKAARDELALEEKQQRQ